MPKIHRLISLLFLSLPLVASLSADDRGREIMTAAKNRHKVPREDQVIAMTLISKTGQEKKRELLSQSIETSTGETKGMLKFSEPADIRDVGLLTWEHAGEAEDDQWLYIPASKQVKRIVAGAKKNKFMNTEFAFEDLRPEDLEAYDYTFLRDDTWDGQPVHVIEATPRSASEIASSGYSKRVVFIRQDIQFLVRVEFFDKRGKHEKTLVNSELVNVRDAIWRAGQSVMTDETGGTQTSMAVTSRNFTPEWDESWFTQRNLERRTR